MSLVMNLSGQITVLHFGKKIAEGSTQTIEGNQGVIDAGAMACKTAASSHPIP